MAEQQLTEIEPHRALLLPVLAIRATTTPAPTTGRTLAILGPARDRRDSGLSLRPVAVPGGGLAAGRATAARAGPAVGSGSTLLYNTAGMADSKTRIVQSKKCGHRRPVR